jgi:prevent-host-death family protein
MLDKMGNMMGELLDMESLMKSQALSRPASDVKAHWRDIVDQANAVGEVIVTSYNRPEVVVVSIDRYTKLKHDASANDPLAALRAEFDQELAVLREPDAARKLRRAFSASPAEIAKAANAKGSRKR